MKETKRQHLVPRCYLRKFGNQQGKKHIVDVYNKKKKTDPFFTSPVEGVCVQIDFYTISTLPNGQKRYIETFYDKFIEKNYPIAYNILVNDKGRKLSNSSRLDIINFVVSQYLRTDKHFKFFNQFWDDMLEHGYNLLDPKKDLTKIHLEGGDVIDFKGKTLEQVKKEQAQNNKDVYNQGTIERIFKVSQLRLFDKIGIMKMHPSIKLITSDNPVQFSTGLYDENAYIRMPLNENYLLVLTPKKRLDELKNIDKKAVSYDELDEEMSWVMGTFNNIFQVENSEQFIIGKRANLDAALKFYETLDQEKYIQKLAAINAKNDLVVNFMEKLLKL